MDINTNYAFSPVTGISSSLITIAILVGKYYTYEKLGIEGWKAIIPFYGDYVLFKYLGHQKKFWTILVLVLFAILSLVIGSFVIFLGAGYHGIYVNQYSTYPLVGLGIVILGFILLIITCLMQSKVYKDMAVMLHKQPGYGWGFVLLPYVFWLMSAFDNSYYCD